MLLNPEVSQERQNSQETIEKGKEFSGLMTSGLEKSWVPMKLEVESWKNVVF